MLLEKTKRCSLRYVFFYALRELRSRAVKPLSQKLPSDFPQHYDPLAAGFSRFENKFAKSTQVHVTGDIRATDDAIWLSQSSPLATNNYPTFKELKVHSRLMSFLEGLGITHLTAVQLTAFPTILKGKDCTVVAPTGSGKTLCYILPILQRLYEIHDAVRESRNDAESWDNPLSHVRPCIILQPSRDLCYQVVQMIQDIDRDGLASIQSLIPHVDFPQSRLGLKRAKRMQDHFNTAVARQQESAVLESERIRWGSVDIVVSTPEKFLIELRRYAGDPLLPSALVIDEVDSVFTGTASENHMLDIIKMIRPGALSDFYNTALDAQTQNAFEQQPKPQPCLGPSSGRVPLLERISDQEIPPVQVIFVGATNPEGRSNTSGQRILRRWPTALSAWTNDVDHVGDNCSITEKWHFLEHNHFRAKLQCLSDAIASPGQLLKTLVLFNSRNRCRDVYKTLKEKQWPVTIYHKALDAHRRMLELDSFCRNKKRQILLATDAAGRGLDLFGIDHVINFDFPDNVQKYLHRCGRSGRAGYSGLVTNIVTPEDAVLAAAIRELQSKQMSLAPAYSRKRSLSNRVDQEMLMLLKQNEAVQKTRETPVVSKLSARAKAKLWKQDYHLKQQFNRRNAPVPFRSRERLKKLRALFRQHRALKTQAGISTKQNKRFTAAHGAVSPHRSVIAGLESAYVEELPHPASSGSADTASRYADTRRSEARTDTPKTNSFNSEASFEPSPLISQNGPLLKEELEPNATTVYWEDMFYTLYVNKPERPGSYHRVSLAAAELAPCSRTSGRLRRGCDSLAGLGRRQLRDLDDLDTLLG